MCIRDRRYSYYGMRSILYLFMTEHLLNSSGAAAPMDPDTATMWQHRFGFGVYFFPILGALLSDWLWGKYRTIIALSLMYCLGHGVLALVDHPALTEMEPRTLLIFAMLFLSLGAGGIKPCVSAHVGDQFGVKNQHLVPRVFQWFYFAINVGAMASMIITPRLMDSYGPSIAFGVPGVVMAVATLIFWLGRYKYAHIPPTGNRVFSEIASENGRRAIANLVPLYFFVMMFFCLFEQTQSKWVEQAKSMDRTIFGVDFNPAEFQAVNSIFVLILIPIFATVVYPTMGRFFEVTPLRKIGIGLFVTAASFVVPALIQTNIDAGGRPVIAWQILAYVILTAAEIMVSITALEFSYTQAPKSLKSVIMGIFLLAIAIGNLLTAEVNGRIKVLEEAGYSFLTNANYYWTFTAAMLLTAIVFVVWSQFYRGRVYIQGDESAA